MALSAVRPPSSCWEVDVQLGLTQDSDLRLSGASAAVTPPPPYDADLSDTVGKSGPVW